MRHDNLCQWTTRRTSPLQHRQLRNCWNKHAPLLRSRQSIHQQKLHQKPRISPHPSSQPIKCKNVDGTPNKLGTINYAMTLWLDVHGKRLQTRFLVTRLGQEKAILSMPWLRKISPNIDWSKGMLWFREPEAITIWLVCTARKAPYILKRRPFKAKGW